MQLKAFSLLRYNWPLYAVCLGSICAGAGFYFYGGHALLRAGGLAVCIIAAWYGIASFVAFLWMFDGSRFLSGEWLREGIKIVPASCTQLCIALDATVIRTENAFPDAKCDTYDLFDGAINTESAISRAKSQNKISQYPKLDATQLAGVIDPADLVLVTLAAHEIRDCKTRQKFMRELTRVTNAGGKIIIVEHLRNLSAFLAFGPGLFHFYPRSLWLAHFSESQMAMEREFSLTPFVHVFVLTPLPAVPTKDQELTGG